MIDLLAIDCVAYLRVSTERQAGEDRTSLADQTRAIETLAAQLGRTIAHIFRDEGASGATVERRPGFRALLAACEAAPRSVRHRGFVLVLNDSRFGRFEDPEDSTYWRMHLKRLGWDVRFAENDDTRDLEVRNILRAVHGSQASAYRKSVKANARRGSSGTASLGFWATRAPFGYRRRVVSPIGRERDLANGMRKSPDEKVALVAHPDEAPIVRDLFVRYASGMHSLESLVEWALVEVPSRKWARAGIRYMLMNPVYVGDVVWGRTPADNAERALTPQRPDAEWTVRPDAHEPIVDRSLFARVQARMGENRRRTRGVRSDWILSGLVRCRCGAAFSSGGGGGKNRSTGGRIPVYRCSTRGMHPSARCSYPGTVVKHYLERAVVQELALTVDSKSTRSTIVRMVDRLIALLEAAPANAADALQTELRVLEGKRDRLITAVSEGTVTALEAQRKLAEFRGQIADLAGRRAAIGAGTMLRSQLQADRDTMVSLASGFAGALQHLTGPALRARLAPWIRSAVFNTSTRILRLEIRRVPSVGAAGDLIGMAYHPDRKSSAEPVVVRRIVVGRAR